ncbi:MAG: HRDC domain-containing protein, partial [Planctomycetes bacterium]|nr:HRDC domain-containing protein [Planctomycetota bacterium]
TFGLLSDLKQQDVAEVIEALLAAGLLEQADVDRNRPVIRLTEQGGEVMRDQAALPQSFALSLAVARKLMKPGDSVSTPGIHPAASSGPLDDMPAPDPGLERELRQWRRKAAEAAGCPAYRILTNATLERLAAYKPASLEELLEIKGIGHVTADTHGHQLLAMIARSGPVTSKSEKPPEIPPPPASLRDRMIQEPAAAYDAGQVDGGVYADSESNATGGAFEVAADSDAHVRRKRDEPESLTEPALTIEQSKVKPSFYWSWRLLRDGFTAEECRQIRRLDDTQLVTHLLQAMDQDLPVEAAWIFDSTQLASLADVVGDEPPRRLRPLLQRLPPEIRHEHLQLYLRCRGVPV